MNTKRTPLRQRFDAKFTRLGKRKCWIWTGSPNSAGYGTIRMPGRGGKTVLAHRLAFEFNSGSIPNGLCVLHECDTPLCVNPSHLFLGTVLDNNKDRDRKGRCRAMGLPGEGCGHHKLKEEQVVAILKDQRTHASIASAYNVARPTVTNIKLGRTWKPTFLRTVGKWKDE